MDPSSKQEISSLYENNATAHVYSLCIIHLEEYRNGYKVSGKVDHR